MPLSIRICSDLHLEFEGSFRLPVLENEKEQILVIAGDLGLAKKPYTYIPFIEDVSDRFREVIYINGNHEHYKGNFPSTHNKIYCACLDYDNVNVLEKETVVFDGVAFICATLWSDMNKHDPNTIWNVEAVMNDYKGSIRTGPSSTPWRQKLRTEDTIADHLNAKHYIFEEIKKQTAAGNKIVVVTHMSPCWKSVAEQHISDPVTGAYVSDLSEQILDLVPNLWIHGHLHNNSDYEVGDTRIICNPRGYVTKNPADLNHDFDPRFVVQV